MSLAYVRDRFSNAADGLPLTGRVCARACSCSACRCLASRLALPCLRAGSLACDIGDGGGAFCGHPVLTNLVARPPDIPPYSPAVRVSSVSGYDLVRSVCRFPLGRQRACVYVRACMYAHRVRASYYTSPRFPCAPWRGRPRTLSRSLLGYAPSPVTCPRVRACARRLCATVKRRKRLVSPRLAAFHQAGERTELGDTKISSSSSPRCPGRVSPVFR